MNGCTSPAPSYSFVNLVAGKVTLLVAWNSVFVYQQQYQSVYLEFCVSLCLN
jgi:hypothetical protein